MSETKRHTAAGSLAELQVRASKMERAPERQVPTDESGDAAEGMYTNELMKWTKRMQRCQVPAPCARCSSVVIFPCARQPVDVERQVTTTRGRRKENGGSGGGG